MNCFSWFNIHYSDIFCWKNMSSFCKSYSHFFSKKFQHICVSLDVNFNESLTKDDVSFEQLGPVFEILVRALPLCLCSSLVPIGSYRNLLFTFIGQYNCRSFSRKIKQFHLSKVSFQKRFTLSDHLNVTHTNINIYFDYILAKSRRKNGPHRAILWVRRCQIDCSAGCGLKAVGHNTTSAL